MIICVYVFNRPRTIGIIITIRSLYFLYTYYNIMIIPTNTFCMDKYDLQ